VDAAAAVINAIDGWRAEVEAPPLVVAIDGHGAAGKSTIAERVATERGVAVVHVDDFWRVASAVASGPPREGHPLAAYYDWTRLREQALGPLLECRPATFVAVDPDTGASFERVVAAAEVVLIEGVSAAAEPIADLVDRSVLVETPEPQRLARLRRSVPPGQWDDNWLDAERRYLSTRPPSSFDLVVSGSTAD
jgi:uridine kinase